MLWLLRVWPFLIPTVAAFYMFWLGWRKAGDPQGDSATIQYGPPDNLSPAEWFAAGGSARWRDNLIRKGRRSWPRRSAMRLHYQTARHTRGYRIRATSFI